MAFLTSHSSNLSEYQTDFYKKYTSNIDIAKKC